MGITKDLFELEPFGKIALCKLSPVPPNFRLFYAGWLEDDAVSIMKVTGAEEMRALK